ncbi:MAG: RNA pseudouridine synthase, partial [Lachnospiraceae bacterium]|nr:RNA pseudouridine synthase [Lachnospiraceae bacterium]
MKECFIVENQEGERIDRYLSDTFEDRSRSYIQKLIKDDLVIVNQKPVKASYRLLLGDQVEITHPEVKEPDIVPENIPLDILYE